MASHEIILLIALSVALATWGIAQFIISLIHGDRHKLQHRLTSDWNNDVDTLLNRQITVRPDLKGIPPFLASLPFIQNIHRKLLYAYPQAKLVRFLAFVAVLSMSAFVIATLITDSLLFGLFAGAIGSYLPLMHINGKRTRRQRTIAEQLPDALDFLTRVLRAGHSLSTGIQMMGDELPQPIGAEFRRCYDQHSLGQSLEDCLREMAHKIDSSDFAFFVTAVLIQRQTGGDLSEVLANISTMIRGRMQLQQHVKAITAEGRLTGYILFAFPVVLFVISYVLNPAYAGVLIKTDVGQKLLAAAIAMQFIGLFAIRKIVAVKV
jgi:tight adherence protein B